LLFIVELLFWTDWFTLLFAIIFLFSSVLIILPFLPYF
jgi:hypothetical protein